MVLKCHLIFTTSSGGTLYSVWSQEDVPGALAIWIPEPTKKIPAYLLKKNDGRMELTRNLIEHRQKYYTAYAQFVKQANKFDGTFINFKEHGGTEQASWPSHRARVQSRHQVSNVPNEVLPDTPPG